jgi:L-ascorbate metabolism protein UlaG (beta-lactamase superfamily)
MNIKWLGHAAFLITSQDNFRVVTDPYTPGGALVYAPINESADVVTISHEHTDHDNARTVKGNPVIIKEAGSKTVKGVGFRSISVFHDEAGGSKRGKDLVFCFQIDGLNLCHLGDLGHLLTSPQISQIGQVDILFIPVGGYYTINVLEASFIVKSLNPKVVFPMHYKTSKTSYPISGIEEFLKDKQNIWKIKSSQIEINQSTLPGNTEIIILEHAN